MIGWIGVAWGPQALLISRGVKLQIAFSSTVKRFGQFPSEKALTVGSDFLFGRNNSRTPVLNHTLVRKLKVLILVF